jgi:ribosomal RNA-processing protein 17
LLAEAQKAGQRDEQTSDVASEEDDDWAGIEDEQLVEPIDHTEEYIDEDKYTSVAIEAVNIDREGIHKAINGPEAEDGPIAAGSEQQSTSQGANATARRHAPQKRKKKFRYETKTERRAGGRRKERSTRPKR